MPSVHSTCKGVDASLEEALLQLGFTIPNIGPSAGDCGPYAICQLCKRLGANIDIEGVRLVAQHLLNVENNDTNAEMVTIQRHFNRGGDRNQLLRDSVFAAYQTEHPAVITGMRSSLLIAILRTEEDGDAVYMGQHTLLAAFCYIMAGSRLKLSIDQCLAILECVSVTDDNLTTKVTNLASDKYYLVHNRNHFVLAWKATDGNASAAAGSEGMNA